MYCENIVGLYGDTSGELVMISKIRDSYFIHYGVSNGRYNCTAGAFHSYKEAEDTLYRHRPSACPIGGMITDGLLILSNEQIDLVYAALMSYGNKILGMARELPTENDIINGLCRRSKEAFDLAEKVKEKKK